MKNDRMAVFGGAILALIIMTILSTMMGLVLPALIPKKYTHIIGGILFLYFGVKLLLDSRGMEDKVSEELEEVWHLRCFAVFVSFAGKQCGRKGRGGFSERKEIFF